MQRKVKKTLTFLMALVMVMSLICGSGFSAIAAETGLTEPVTDSSTEAETVPQSDVYETEIPAGIQEEPVSVPVTEPALEESGTNEGTVPSETPTEAVSESGTELPENAAPSESMTEAVSESETNSEAASEMSSETNSETVTEAETSEKESETDSEKESEKTTEAEKPEFTYSETVNGICVKIHAPAGILPTGTTVTVKPLAADVLETAEQAINNTLGEKEVVQLIGFDITFYDADGNEMHDLDGAVRIEYSGMDIVDEAEEARVYHADENGNITNALTEAAAPAGTVGFTSDKFSPVLYAVYAENDEISPLAADPISIAVGETYTISSTHTGNSSWKPTDSNIATVNDNGVVTGVSAGQTTITHTYCTKNHRHWNSLLDPCNSRGSETFEVTVTGSAEGKNEGAQVYYLKSPTSDPNSNDTGEWGPVVQYNGSDATVNVPGNVTWTNNKNLFKQNVDISAYIVSWPDGSTGVTWTLDKGKFPDVYQSVYETYKAELERELGIDDLQLSDIEEITLVPYKISKDNGTKPSDKHIDCTISVVCSKAYVARFNVQMPNDQDYTNVSAQNKKIVNDIPDSVEKYVNENTIPETTVVDGITYRFDGWYNEAGEKIDESGWPYSPNEDELADGTVNFYAKYVQATTSITIEKKVTGGLGDFSKDFHFSYSWNGGETYTFTLKHNEQYTIENVPIGGELTLTETDAIGYTVSAKYGESEQNADENGTMKFTVSADDTNIVVTNNKEGYPDTGITLDSLPYIIILAVVIAGAILFVIGRRRKYRA